MLHSGLSVSPWYLDQRTGYLSVDSATLERRMATGPRTIRSGNLPIDPHSVANTIESNWNSSIEKNGDFTMSIDVGSKNIEIEDNQDNQDAHAEAQDKIYSEYDLTGYDSVLYLASVIMKGSGGLAPGDAGTNPPPVAIVDSSANQASLRIHEVGHHYGAEHERSRKWGVAEYTAMGNGRSMSGCKGNTFSEWWARRPKFSPDCDTITPNELKIRHYMIHDM